MAKTQETTASQEPAEDLEKLVEEWFFQHFHQECIVSNPVVFTRAKVAKDELLKLLGISK